MLKNLKNLTLPEIEEKVLEFWQEKKIFEKSLKKPAAKGSYVFYDGPPFATGLPHYGHILAGIIKDAIPRYQTMKGKRVPRRWGWDCHGLPVENEIEKDLGFKTKKDIEKFGIGKFNETARSAVLRYADEWKKIIPRVGRWVDMENDYKTMDADYTESVWWVFKKLYDLGLVYEDYRVAPYCPRCGTPLSNFELNQPDAYRDIEDQSIYIKFEIRNPKPETNSKLKTQNSKTYFLVWTTTPWTLPGNVALAIGPKIKYVRVKIGDERLILAEEQLDVLSEKYEIEGEFLGKDLVGFKYEPPFRIQNSEFRIQNGYRVVAADFVSVEDGTGIVHIAPAFGEDDMEVGKKEKLPTLITVDLEGKIKKDLKIPGEGLFVKAADKEIKNDLRKRGLLFKEEKIVHSYPHCWRCETPLLYFPVSSWYIAVKKIKKQLIENNKKIHWIPEHIKTGRFGKWLEEVRDWDVARTRFWGAPLPIWQCQIGRIQNSEFRIKNSCEKQIIIGSLEELKKHIKKSGNKYFVMRHGQAETNVKNIINSDIKKNHYHLTDKGRGDVEAAAKKLNKEKIDLIFSSDFLRTKETAEIVAGEIGLDKSKIILDSSLKEINTGIFDGQDVENYRKFATVEEKFVKTPPEGENLTDLKNRVAEFLYEIDAKYKNKNILIVSHEHPIWLLFSGAVGADAKKTIKLRGGKADFIKTGEVKDLNFTPLPHNHNFELDFHRPHIDEVQFPCVCGGKMKRVPDVLDCWFESGAMPYAQSHYPFENKKEFNRNFPAEFIAEGIDQTRGWFYTLLVLSTALFNKPAYKNVVVNGIILAEDGTKMSKRLKNYPDPIEIINKYGADALRLYLLSSPVVKGENLNFSEKGVDEVYKKVILRLWNVYKFYELYTDKKILNFKSKISNLNILDKWILAQLNVLIGEVSKALDNYELDKATRPISDFIDDLSTWYIRRSRERFKNEGGDKQGVIATTKFVLLELSKTIASFMPFMAEAIYQQIANRKAQSVHLESWSAVDKMAIDRKLLKQMAKIRRLASLALEARAKTQIKVRQPLSELRIKNAELRNKNELLEILADEINVKKIIFDAKIKNEIELNTKITPELKAEGDLRELARMIQDLRKEAGYTPKDKIYLYLEAPKEIEYIVKKHLKGFQEKIGAKNIEFCRSKDFDAEEETQIGDSRIWIGIKKI